MSQHVTCRGMSRHTKSRHGKSRHTKVATPNSRFRGQFKNFRTKRRVKYMSWHWKALGVVTWKDTTRKVTKFLTRNVRNHNFDVKRHSTWSWYAQCHDTQSRDTKFPFSWTILKLSHEITSPEASRQPIPFLLYLHVSRRIVSSTIYFKLEDKHAVHSPLDFQAPRRISSRA